MSEAYFMLKFSCDNTTPNGSRVKTKAFCYLYADNTDTTNRDRQRQIFRDNIKNLGYIIIKFELLLVLYIWIGMREGRAKFIPFLP